MVTPTKWLCALLAFALCSCASREPGLEGAWLTQSAQPGQRPMLLTFERRGDAFAGTLASTLGTMELSDIEVDGDQVSFKRNFGPPPGMVPGGPPPMNSPVMSPPGASAGPPPTGPGAMALVKGTLTQDRLQLSMPIPGPTPGGTEQVTAHRANDKEVAAYRAATPKKQPLPPVREVPDTGLARTPPMGWNSWNKFATAIDDKTVREIADALVSSGLRDAGFVYVNIDDGWQGERDANGVLHPNAKFPDMKALADYVHGRGLKFGIYSSPGPYTCGGYVGSHGHEEQDAKMFAAWGVDYLKHDWCSAMSLYEGQAEMQALYQKMGEALQATGRPIVYALCQYGMFDVGQWGRKVGGNVWRTTGDIRDTWQAMADIGFNQNGREVHAGPGGWNDPDMLEVGNGGMTLDEYRTHMTLWSMLSAPLLLGNDVRNMTPETRALLTNKEVIAVDQDALGKQAQRILQQGETEVWSKALGDGSTAVAVFNRGETSIDVDLRWADLGLAQVTAVRDLWQLADVRANDQGHRASLPPHGAALLRVSSRK